MQSSHIAQGHRPWWWSWSTYCLTHTQQKKQRNGTRWFLDWLLSIVLILLWLWLYLWSQPPDCNFPSPQLPRALHTHCAAVREGNWYDADVRKTKTLTMTMAMTSDHWRLKYTEVQSQQIAFTQSPSLSSNPKILTNYLICTTMTTYLSGLTVHTPLQISQICFSSFEHVMMCSPVTM